MATNSHVRAPRRRPDRSAGRAERPFRALPNRRVLALAAAAAVALAGTLIGIGVSGSGSGAPKPASITGAAATRSLLAGIPQHGLVLGRLDAPVKLVEYGDLQCPICREFAVGTLPTIIRDYVRPGKVQLAFRGLAFLGPDSQKALRAVIAAGMQNRAWHLIDLLYRNQGAENSGWVSDALLRSALLKIPGIDVADVLTEERAVATTTAMRTAQQQAEQAMGSELRTPTFEVARSGRRLEILPLQSLAASAFTPTLDRLLAG